MITNKSALIVIIVIINITFCSCKENNCQSKFINIQNKHQILIQKFSFGKNPDTLRCSKMGDILQVLNNSDIKIDTLYNIVRSKEFIIEELEWLNHKFKTNLFLDTKYLELVEFKIHSDMPLVIRDGEHFSGIKIVNFFLKKEKYEMLDKIIKSKIERDTIPFKDATMGEYKYIPFKDDFILIFFFRQPPDKVISNTFDKIYNKCIEESKKEKK